MNLTLISAPRPIMAQNKDEYIQLPNTSGSILIEDGTLNDILITATFVLKETSREVAISTGYQIGEWLQTIGRKKLIFDDYPSRYYLAKAHTQTIMNPEEGFESIGEIVVEFRCDPIMRDVTPTP